MAGGGDASILEAAGFAFTRGMAAVQSQSLLRDPLPERRDDWLHPTSCRELFFRRCRPPAEERAEPAFERPAREARTLVNRQVRSRNKGAAVRDDGDLADRVVIRHVETHDGVAGFMIDHRCCAPA